MTVKLSSLVLFCPLKSIISEISFFGQMIAKPQTCFIFHSGQKRSHALKCYLWYSCIHPCQHSLMENSSSVQIRNSEASWATNICPFRVDHWRGRQRLTLMDKKNTLTHGSIVKTDQLNQRQLQIFSPSISKTVQTIPMIPLIWLWTDAFWEKYAPL